MGPYLESVINVMLDRSVEEWIQGLMVALFLALGLAGAYRACRRWTKATDDTVPLVVPGIVAILAGMVIAAGFVQLKLRPGAASSQAGPARAQDRPFRGPGGMTSRMANLIFEAADADRDGRLSTDEAATAAANFVKEVDADGKAAIDRDELIGALRERLRPPGAGAPAPAPPPSS